MSAPIVELEKLLTLLVRDHQELADAMQQHQQAMRNLRSDLLTSARTQIESCRNRILAHETRRRVVVQQIIRLHRLQPNPSLQQLAEVVPAYRDRLLKLREELTRLTAQIGRQNTISARLAGAMLGHLNTVVRIVSGAVQQASVYTKQGMPTVASRVGVMEAVA